MPATFDVKLDIGGSDGSPGQSLTVTNLRMKTADDNDQDTNNPVPIVAGYTKRSFWRSVYLKCTTAPPTKCDNVKFYTDGTPFGTGIVLYAGEQFPTKNSGSSSGYEKADGTVGDTGDEMVAGHGGLTSKVDVFTKTQGTPLSGPTISESGGIINAIDETTNYLILQLEVIDTATAGTLTAETMTFQYDEV